MSITTNKILLELAAKAIGYTVIKYHEPPHGTGALSAAWSGPWLEVKKPESPLGNCRWNPLTNDDDAFRLFVKLQLTPYVPTTEYPFACCQNGSAFIDETVPVGDDPTAATRRAIVLAAAELGRIMKEPLTWVECEQISDLPAVDEALFAFSMDATAIGTTTLKKVM